MPLNVLHSIESLQQKLGGPSRSVTGLCNSLGQLGVSMTLISMDTPEQITTECIAPDNKVVKHFPACGLNIPFLKIQYAVNHFKIINGLNKIKPIEILHDHGLWLSCNHASAVAAQRLGLCWVVSPRGMLEPNAFKYSNFKKKIARKLWVDHDLRRANAFCAASQQESESIRQAGFTQPIAVIPNGVNLPSLESSPVSSICDIRTVLFLSRIHPQKGVCELIEAWARVRPKDWELLIAGPDEGGHSREVRSRISKYRLETSVRLIGPVDGEAKWHLYQHSDLFVLPTFTENFGIVVAESLAMGTPVITTKRAPWECLVRYNCGWWIDTGVESLVQALRDATSLSDETRGAMGLRGRKFVGRSFAWNTIALKMEVFYRWLLGQGEKPDFVRGAGE